MTFKKEPLIYFTSFARKNQFIVKLNCNVEEIENQLFNKDLLAQRFDNAIESTTKLKLNIIKNIVDSHDAILNCSSEEKQISFELTFNVSN